MEGRKGSRRARTLQTQESHSGARFPLPQTLKRKQLAHIYMGLDGEYCTFIQCCFGVYSLATPSSLKPHPHSTAACGAGQRERCPRGGGGTQ